LPLVALTVQQSSSSALKVWTVPLSAVRLPAASKLYAWLPEGGDVQAAELPEPA
jgi:hypothetical protein